MFYGLMRDSAVIGTYRYAVGKAKRSARKNRAKVVRRDRSQVPKGKPISTAEPVLWED